MASNRSAALRGERLDLSITFYDANQNAVDPSPLNSVVLNIYPPGYDPRTGNQTANAWILNATQTDGGTGPYASSGQLVQRTGVGRFTYSFVLPADSELGLGFDSWEATVDNELTSGTFTFVIVGGGTIASTQLYKNNVVYIELDKDIAAEDGTTLGSDYQSYFTTTYDPLYAPARRLRIDLGNLISNIPDDTLNLVLFEASRQADDLMFVLHNGGMLANTKYFARAKYMYTVCLAKVMLLEIILSNGGAAKYKRLGDLDVRYDDSITDVLNEARQCMMEYEDILKNGGHISLKPQMAIKGSRDPDRPQIGRVWEPTSTWGSRDSQIPAANTRTRQFGKRRYKKNYINRTRRNKK
jgi:hypothetical protein